MGIWRAVRGKGSELGPYPEYSSYVSV